MLLVVADLLTLSDSLDDDAVLDKTNRSSVVNIIEMMAGVRTKRAAASLATAARTMFK